MSTHEYYKNKARKFFKRTVSVPMDGFYNDFLSELPEGGHILDAGCGSGRDTKNFLDLGYQVTSFDASVELSALAEEYTGQNVKVCRFLEFKSDQPFDGIWASASLLHVRKAELSGTVLHLLTFLKEKGLFYLSFKWGAGERKQGLRYFNDHTIDSLTEFLKTMNEFTVKKVWRTESVARPGGRPFWVNAIVQKH
ncbi:MAG: class I SAM-dependent methyltransferase [Planctomycetota bacterium]|nr:class I SAM-dependent methyltransferase [Planctomycetota bacterium]